ncbi:outer membrane protein assembly factor BamD [Alphaproteobacteria bacterium]|nr:outer membrane protein assembly factor BamD [Alphaproteobacteria bacterium]
MKEIDMRAFSLIFIMALSVLLIGCSSGSEEKKLESETEPVESLYNRASEALDSGEKREAIRLFEEVERLHPYSKWSNQAQLMSGYAAYSNQDYDEAVLTLDRFTQLHPGHLSIDYAYYLKALCFYEQITDVSRDQEITELALSSFDSLLRRFPESRYARDATLKRDLTLDHLAGKEMEIGRYYLRRNHVNAAINRFRVVIKEYQTTTHIAEALHRLVESYLILGLKHEAVRIAAVLGHNYPGSKWYERSYELLDDESRQRIIENRGFVDRTVDSLFKAE